MGYFGSLASHLLQSFYMPGLATAQVRRDLEGTSGPNIDEIIPVTLGRVKNVIQMYFTNEYINKQNQLAFILAQTISDDLRVANICLLHQCFSSEFYLSFKKPLSAELHPSNIFKLQTSTTKEVM